MKWIKYCALTLIVFFSFVDNEAWARRHHSHSRARVSVGIGLGVPVFHSYHRPYRSSFGFYPYYSYPYAPYTTYTPYAPVVVERPVYIERAVVEPEVVTAAPVMSQAAPDSYWYYCPASKAYYPYVGKCPSGWRKVSTHPAGVR